MKTKSEYKGDDITVYFDSSLCIHAGICVQTLPDVFNVDTDGPWIVPDNADAEDIAALAQNCPSGAITYHREDINKQEEVPSNNIVRVLENGPLAFKADLSITDNEPVIRAALCRCGQSKNKPYCDNSHVAMNFKATGEPAEQTFENPGINNGRVNAVLLDDGPIICKGDMFITTGTAHKINSTQEVALCRCGASKNKPYCDGSHTEAGFKS